MSIERSESDGANMWKFKGCPKCRGDVFVEKDFDGWYEVCLQGGYSLDLPSIVEVRRQPVRKKKRRALVGTAKVASK